MLKQTITLVILTLLFSAPAVADQLSLKNGDKLTGKIVKSDGKAVVIETEYAGTITIVWDSVTSITSDGPLYMTLADGRTITGVVSTTGEQIEVRSDGAAPVATPKATIAALRSPSEQAEYERLQDPGLFEQWTGRLSAALGLTRGNSDTTNIALGFGASRSTPRDKIAASPAPLHPPDSPDGDSRTPSNAIRGGLRYDYNFTERWFGYGFTSLEHNELQDLDLRLTLGGGLGYHAIRGERTQLDIFGGAAWNKEWFGTVDDRSSAEGLAGQSLAVKLGSRSTVTEQFVYFANLSDTGEYRLNFDTTMSTAITERIGSQHTVSNRFLSNPPPGFERNDLIVTTGVNVRLGR
jgi:putative salt-induced outer membrane protein YdiY